jgi:hypothetical protein
MSGAQTPSDDDSIPREKELWRRIPPWQWIADPNVAAGYRPTSDAFDDPDLSVVIADECIGGVQTLLAGHDGFGVASFTVADIRDRGWGIVRVADDELPGHAYVTRKKSHGKRSSLAKNCKMLVIPAVPPTDTD